MAEVAAPVVQLVGNDNTLLLVGGAAGGIVGFLIGKMYSQWQNTNHGGIWAWFEEIGTLLTGLTTDIIDLFEGDWVWWAGSAFGGLAAAFATHTFTGGLIAPLVAAPAAGVGVYYIYETFGGGKPF